MARRSSAGRNARQVVGPRGDFWYALSRPARDHAVPRPAESPRGFRPGVRLPGTLRCDALRCPGPHARYTDGANE